MAYSLHSLDQNGRLAAVPAIYAKEMLTNFDGSSNPLPLLQLMFPTGPGGPDVLNRLAPEGWQASSLRLAFHPVRDRMTKEQRKRERQLHGSRMSQAIKRLVTGPRPHVSDEIECAELVALCFQNLLTEHELLDADGVPCWMDTWRGTGGSLADWVNRALNINRYDYLDFYMGAFYVAHRTDLTPVYELIFSRLRQIDWDWYYLEPYTGQHELTDAELGADRFHPGVDAQGLQQEIARKPYGRMVAAYLSEYRCLPKGWFPAPADSPSSTSGWVPSPAVGVDERLQNRRISQRLFVL